MRRLKFTSFSHLLTPILLIGTLLFAGLVTFFSVKTDRKEEENIKNYTHARMKSLILDLETRTMSLEAAMITASHMRKIGIVDSATVYRRMESLCRDLDFVYMAGLDFWEEPVDSALVSLYVSRTPDGFAHHCMIGKDRTVPAPEVESQIEAFETGRPVWSTPYVDDDFNDECVLTCYYRIADQYATIFADVEMDLLLHTIDSLQFYQDSKMYITVPGGPTYTIEGEEISKVPMPSYDAKDFYEISAHYRHLNLDIMFLVPKDRVYNALLDDLSVLLVIFILGLAVLAFFVHQAFKSAQSRLRQSIEKSHEEQMARKHLEDEIAIAARIQNKMLTDPGKPAHFHPKGCHAVDLATRIIPAREVGGDFYEYRLSGDKLFFCIGDVSGKGIPASIVMSRCSTLFHAYVSHAHSQNPADLLLFFNQQLCRQNEEVMFATMWAGSIDLRSGVLEYASAAHNPPVVICSGDARFLEMSQGLPLGMFDDSTYVNCSFNLNEDDVILLYTDGITEAEGPDHNLFGDGRLLETCLNSVSCIPEVVCRGILEAVHRHAAGCSQSDDITLLAIAYGSQVAQLKGVGDVPAIHVLTAETGASYNAAVAVEEAAVNAFTHGGADFVCVKHDSGSFVLYNDGDEFDPTAYVAPATDEMTIGGRGILLMRQFCSEIIYDRTDDGLNVLKLKM